MDERENLPAAIAAQAVAVQTELRVSLVGRGLAAVQNSKHSNSQQTRKEKTLSMLRSLTPQTRMAVLNAAKEQKQEKDSLHTAKTNDGCADGVIDLIRESNDPKAALIERFELSERQAEDMLEIRLRQLAMTEGIRIQSIVRCRSEPSQPQFSDRLHILEGRMTVFLNIDEVIYLIRESGDPKAALIERFELSERQVEDILEIRLRQLAMTEGIRIEKEIKALEKERREPMG